MMRRVLCLSTVLVCLLNVPRVRAAETPGVRVDAFTNLVLGDQPDISATMFGITAFEGFPSVVADPDYRAHVAALRPGCIRLAGNIAWCAPLDYDPVWYATPAAAREFSQVLLFGSRYPTGRFLPIVRELGAEPMCSLGSPPPYLRYQNTPDPSDFDKWAAYCAAYVGLWKKFDPLFRLVQIWNEPNAHWFKDPRASDKGTSAADLHIQMANKVARAIKQRFPDIQVGGPVLCWAPAWPPGQKGMPPWYTWNSWTLPWLRDTKDTIDFFDFHVYGIAPDDFAVQTEMLENQAQLTQGRRLPIWITESNMDLPPDELNDPKAIWRKRILPYERLLLYGMLPQTDKLAGNLYHDLHAKSHTLLPRGANDPDPAYWLLWILRDLRGRRVVADSRVPGVTSFATLEEDRVTVVLFNDNDVPKSVPLEVAMPGGYWTGPYVRAIGEDNTGGCSRIDIDVKVTRNGNCAACLVQMPAHATASIAFRLDQFPQLKRQQVIREYFGDRTLQFLTDGKAVKVTVPIAARDADAYKLRVGLLGPDGSEPLQTAWNGAPVPVRPTAFQEIPLAKEQVAATNTFEIHAAPAVHNSRLALGFVAVVATAHLTR